MQINNSSSSSSGLGFIGALQVAFIVLKLCNVIKWTWFCVMLPTIISFGLAIFIAICIVLIGWAMNKFD